MNDTKYNLVIELTMCLYLSQLVRLVANLSVHPEVGPAISQDKDTVDHLFCILGVFEQCVWQG